ncbi:aconitase X [Bacillus sp. 1P02SD]|uniref:aconitase X n=1 Tax=Bacillus sp. 1P02SD TaxID=3132264 RepID=UPI00399FD21A
MNNYKMQLTQEEKDILDGKQGEVMQKVLKSIVLFGEAFGAKRLVPIDGPIHVVTSFGMTGFDAVFNMMDELIGAGLKTKEPFTVDPRPVDFENIETTEASKKVSLDLYQHQEQYEEQLQKLGLKDKDAFSCAAYMKEVGNVPERGQVLSWAESSAVVFANSVIGAKSNRNSGIIELLCGILGKTPEFGFLTEEGRKAKWLVEVKTSKTPNPMLLGSAIGMKVVEDTPYITGLDKLLGNELNNTMKDFLKDMGAATASNGAVGLYHIENVTPEAVDQGRDLLVEGYQTYVIDDEELNKVMASYPVLWDDMSAEPAFCFIGCPHLSLNQIYTWNDNIDLTLKKAGKEKVSIRTILSAAPDVISKFKEDEKAYETLINNGVSLSFTCPVMYMNNPENSKNPIITNSNKMRTYSTARFFLDQEVLNIIVNGKNY